MRIALLHLFAWPQVRRGGERYLHELARHLAERGHEVEVVVGSADHVHHQDGVHTTVLRRFASDASPDDAMLTMRGLLSLLRTRPDVAHAFVPNLALSATRARRPTVFTLLGYVPPPQHRSDVWRQAVSSADVVAALNPAIADDLETATGHAAEVLTPGIDLDRFGLDERPRTGPPLLLYSGHLGREAVYKDLDRLVAAFDRLLDRHPAARLQLSGTGDPTWAVHPAPARVRERVDVLGVGELSAVAERYRHATVTVSAARDEAFGLAFLESLACGTPIVAAPRGGPLAFVTEHTGRLAEPSDPDAFAAAIADAIDLARVPGTATRCREHAARWSWEQVGLAHERLYAYLSGGALPAPRTPPENAPTVTVAGTPRAAVVVPVRDRADLLRACLEGLTRQTVTGFEVVVVDDGSTDGSGAVAASFRDRLDVTVVTAPGVGAVEARRRGVAASTAPYLAFTDSDCVPDPDWLAAGVRELERGADVVQGRTRAATAHTPLHRTVSAAPADGLYATCNVFYRRSAYDRAGGFDVGLGERVGFRPGRTQRALGMGEDTALGWRVRRDGRAAHTEDAVVRHHVFAPDLRDDIRRWWMAGGFAGLVREVPELREHFLTARVLIPGRARLLPLAAAVLAMAGRRRSAVIALAAWILAHGSDAGWRPRWLAHTLLRDVVIEAAAVAGSARHRTIVL